MPVKDALTPAIRQVWRDQMALHGFSKIGRRNWARHRDGMLAVFDFQVSQYGSRDFCTNVWISTAASRSGGLLFRLKHHRGADLWLESQTAEQAQRSALEALQAATEQAMPAFEQNNEPARHADQLRKELWGSKHHQHFAIAVAEALAKRREFAARELQSAIELYRIDAARFDWAAKYAVQAEELLDALHSGSERNLLSTWANEKISKIKLSQV